MIINLRALAHKTWRTFASIQTGVVLLILVVILAAVGTIVLQRPATEPDEMQSAYSPQVLRVLDTLGLTDVFHAWWFLGLLLLVSLCIVAASIDRFPNSWRYFSRPYKYPDESFRRASHPQKSLALADEESGLVAAERALHSLGFKPERVVREDHFGIFAERHRISELAVYIVHASLLLIFFGTVVDGIWGWRGYLSLSEGQTSNIVEMRDGTTRTHPVCHPLRWRRPGKLQGRHSEEVVVQAGRGGRRPGCTEEGDCRERSAPLQRCPLLPIELRSEWKGASCCWSRLRAAVLVGGRKSRWR